MSRVRRRSLCVLSLALSVALMCSAEVSAITPSIGYDKFRGACRDFERYLDRRGVQDCDGNRHAGTLGNTRCEIESSGLAFSFERSRSRDNVCLKARIAKNPKQFRVKRACVRIVEWEPAQAITPSCAREREGWLKRALQHENYHVYQCEVEVWRANKRWLENRQQFSACAASEQAASVKVQNELQRVLSAEHRRILETFDRESVRFHRTPAGRPVKTNCNVCER